MQQPWHTPLHKNPEHEVLKVLEHQSFVRLKAIAFTIIVCRRQNDWLCCHSSRDPVHIVALVPVQCRLPNSSIDMVYSASGFTSLSVYDHRLVACSNHFDSSTLPDTRTVLL